MSVRRLVREPLVHFLAVGGLLFAVYSIRHDAVAEIGADRTITVDDESLLNFLQYRSKAFQPDFFATQLAGMSAEDLKSLEDHYVEEEMLYREARALGLEQGDYVIRQRLVQKMRFLIDDLGESGARPSDATLHDYLQTNMERYTIDASVTFTHVFCDPSRHGETGAERMARSLSGRLNTTGAAFDEAPRHGDRFPFLQNYVERTFDYVASHFGAAFAAALKNAAPSDRQWIGPIRSDHGYHLVLMTDRTEARVPDLHEVRTQVEDDWRRDRVERARRLSIARLADEFTIERINARGETSR